MRKEISVRSFYILIILYVFLSQTAEAQSKPGSLSNGFIPDVIPPSPTAASLGKFGAWPVGYYTGVPNISVPIYEVKQGKISLPISLGYHGSGVKVEEMSSATGIGWALNAGGVITRSIIGLPDNNDPNGYLTRLKAGTVFQTSYNLSDPNTFIFFRKVTESDIDTEPDAYYYNFNGHSGKFFFDEKGNFHSIPENALKLTKHPFMSSSAMNIWEIIDESGNTYTFGSTDGVSGGVEQTRIADGSPGNVEFFDNAWYLTRIISGDKSDTISLKYNDKNESYTLKSNQSLKELTAPMTYQPAGAASWPSILNTSKVLYNGTPDNDPMNMRQLVTGKGTLSSIKWSQGEVRFKSGTSRQDMASGLLLDSIEVVSSWTGGLLKKYRLQYSYTGGRYYLDSISEYNKTRTDKLVHQFYYYSGLPSRFSNSQDHWGYFNAAPNNHLLPNNSKLQTTLSANREPDEAAMKAGTLYRIKYPTGGYTDFDYEAHRYQANVTPGAPVTVIGNATVWVANYNPKMPRGFDSTATFNVSDNQSDATIQIEFTDYFKPPVKERAWLPYVKLERLSGSTYVQTNYWNAFDLFPGGAIPANPDGSYNVIPPKITFNLPSGSYRITVDNACNYFDCGEEWQKGHVLAGVSYRTQSTSTPGSGAPPPIAGGLRIKSIKNYDNIASAPVDIRKFEYSPGILLTYPSYIHYYAVDMWAASEQGFDMCHTNFANYIETTSSSQVILGVTQGASVGYQEVREYAVNNQGVDNGYTKYNYLFAADSTNTLNFDHSYWPNWDLASLNNSIPVNNYDYKRGLLSEKTIYARDATGAYLPVSRYKDEYSFNDGDTSKLYRRLKALRVKKLRNVVYPCGNELDTYVVPVGDEYKVDFAYGFYNTVTSWVQKSSSEVTIYSQAGGSALTTLTRYYYDNNKHLGVTRIVTTDSKNQSFTTYFKYPHEMVSSGSTVPYTDMVSRNMISNVIEQRVMKNDVTEIGKDKINYSAFTTNLILPSKLETSVMGNVLEEKSLIQSYDAYGNISQYRERDGLSKSLIYDYNNNQVVANATNAALSDIAYTGFESLSQGNWQMATARNTTTALTGKASYTLSAGDIIKTGLDVAKSYSVSYWAKGASATVNGATGTAGRSANGWTFYQHRLSAGITSVTVKGTVVIDELRLHPQNALMQTYVYEPLVGLIAQSDANNTLSYYEYDSFNRISQIRDQYGNILKKIEYAYVRPGSQSQTSIFFNVQKVQDFKKTCSIGDGSVMTYIVPAEKYKSYVSQADADAYAMADINANGQNYANTMGTCNFYNVQKSKVFTRIGCGLGYVGGTYNYVVPAGRYIVQTNQTAADSLAQREIDLFGQSYTNAHGPCNVDNTANFFIGERANSQTPTFSVTITNINGVVLYQYEFKGIGDPPLPYKELLSSGSSYVVKIQGMQSFNAIVNGVEQVVTGVKSWNVSTPIIIEVYK